MTCSLYYYLVYGLDRDNKRLKSQDLVRCSQENSRSQF